MRDDIAGMVTEGTEDEQSEEQADGDRAEHGPAAVIPETDNLSDRSQEAGERVPFDSEHLPSSSDPVPVEEGESSAEGDSIPPDVPGPESEVAAPAGGAAHLPASTDGPEVPEDGELEELTLPSSIQALEQLPEGSAVGPDNQIAVVRRRGQRGRVNSYLATIADPSRQPVTVALLAGPADPEG